MNNSRKRALETHHRRLAEHGLARYEVRGLDRDKGLVRALARRLASSDEGAARLREDVARGVQDDPPTGREIWLALRQSPLAGLELDIEREITTGRDIAV